MAATAPTTPGAEERAHADACTRRPQNACDTMTGRDRRAHPGRRLRTGSLMCNSGGEGRSGPSSAGVRGGRKCTGDRRQSRRGLLSRGRSACQRSPVDHWWNTGGHCGTQRRHIVNTACTLKPPQLILLHCWYYEYLHMFDCMLLWSGLQNMCVL